MQMASRVSPEERVETGRMRPRLTIGEFSALSHLSIRMLRRYHDRGLLYPDAVDQSSGYRYYTPDQIGTAQTIARLRELDMPVRDIADLLAAPDPEQRQELLTSHLHRLEQRLEQTRNAVSSLRRLMAGDDASFAVQTRQVPGELVAAITDVIDKGEVLGWYADAVAEIDAAVARAGIVETGPPGTLVDDELFTHERGSLTAFVRIDETISSGRIAPLVVPAARLAVTTHLGDHADVDVTYGQLARWVFDQGLRTVGPVREHYLVGPRDTRHSSEWRTEICWPIDRLGEGSA